MTDAQSAEQKTSPWDYCKKLIPLSQIAEYSY